MQLDITHQADRSRYEVDADGVSAGFLAYRQVEDARCLTHIEVDDAFSGRGLATKLVEFALSDARTHQIQVLPACPFVRGYLLKHREHMGLVPAAARPRYGLAAEPTAG